MDPFSRIVQALADGGVRFVVMGVWGANYYALTGAMYFATRDRDLFLPLDAANLWRAWDACAACGLALWAGPEPLDQPRDEILANRVVEVRAVTTARDQALLQIDLSLVMGVFRFEDVWQRRREFKVDGVSVPVARLDDIVAAKAAAGRDKDRLFLATHKEALELMQRSDQPPPARPG